MRGQKTFIEISGQPTVALADLYRDLKEQQHCKVSYEVVCRRIAQGWEAMDALLMPPTTRGRKKGCNNDRTT